MPTFDTPEPITATLHVEQGVAHITAGERPITVVEVHPRTEGDEADLRAARDTRVDFSRGRLAIRTPKSANRRGDSGSVAVEIRLPSGSRVNGAAATGDFTGDGTLGECQLTTMDGDIRLDRTGPARLRTERGDVTVQHIGGMAEIITGSGQIRVHEIDGAAEVKNSNGNTWIDQVTGELRLKVANGNIFVGRAHAGVASKSANGDTRIEQIARGRVDLQTQTGDLEVGINLGTAAWLDVTSQAGAVHNSLGASAAPGKGAQTVQVRARTGVGDIVIRRAQPV
ncbi:DUF4097 family beta strand repeat-containing protein [Streptomyces flavofungini]|uniref:DUF4097 family beta strand repeat-containing protein n=1 Tax=Streptomyces flavofungini TaxID=68200 RepID=UPI0025B0EC0B|nr:DUF4097 family beta strand repeat-containing protein [Streptomyces flavofungini]WJV45018.1 DUF4097 family beta strand repeat-containing protein [Streptomyces flavofungini]